MDITIKINMDNDAFDENGSEELEYCLMRVVELVQDGELDGSLSDTNGNTVGKFIIK